MANKIEILKTKLILAEGRDAKEFLIWALDAYVMDGIQVMDFGGINDLAKFIKTLTKIDKYDEVTSIIVARDAEVDHKSAFNSVKSVLKNNNLSVPDSLFTYTNATPKVAIMLFPGFDASSGNIENGCLEDLCLKTITDKTIDETQVYLQNINNNHEKLTHEHKSKLHAYLSVKNKFVGSKLGEAAKKGAWDWQSSALEPYKNIILQA